MSFCGQAPSQCVTETAPFKTETSGYSPGGGGVGAGAGYLGARSIPLDYQGLGFGSWLGDRVWLMVCWGFTGSGLR